MQFLYVGWVGCVPSDITETDSSHHRWHPMAKQALVRWDSGYKLSQEALYWEAVTLTLQTSTHRSRSPRIAGTKAADFSDELLTYGLANYLEVLTSKNDALNAKLSLVDNKFQQYKAVIQLYRALGGGWQ